MKNNEWFGKWFDSPYYHILYKNRDHEEAQQFIDHIIDFLAPPETARFLDLACGKGRHAIYLNKKGYDVTGIDLSSKNINYAKQFENERLRFYEHDMRQLFAPESFDYVVNLFTSFGYFESKQENQQAIDAVAACMKEGATFVLDFLNPYAVINGLVSEEKKVMGGIEFCIRRSFDGDFIIKDIEFSDENQHYHYQEKVKAIRRVEFLEYFEKAGLILSECFGDYKLASYDPEKSERLIFVTKK